jgi:hypothetical protein
MFALRLLMACSWASHGPLMGCSRRVTHFSLYFSLCEKALSLEKTRKMDFPLILCSLIRTFAAKMQLKQGKDE